ncbi:GHMP kinase, partial [candidate division KSB1 bacterium]|nr:GHMP kinase [candidate division KSB1 bacterium]
GLGSSAAVTAAAVAALSVWLGDDLSPDRLLQDALRIVHTIQGSGSGADIAAAVYGGVLLYHSQPARVVASLPAQVPLTAVYSGAKTPTVEVIRRVQSLHRAHPQLVEAIFDLMEHSALQAAEAWKRGNHATVGEIFNINQGLMDGLGLNTPALNEIVYALRQRPGIYGAKISGSGLGDCVVGLGETGKGDLPGERLPLRISEEGVKID